MEIILGKVAGVNTCDGGLNILVNLENGKTCNIKCSIEYRSSIIQNSIYQFHVSVEAGRYILEKTESIEGLDGRRIEEIMGKFSTVSPIPYEDSKKIVYQYIDKIESSCIKEITLALVKKYEHDFFIYPAATKMHHSYVGGLAYHTIGMLNLGDALLVNYPYLKKDYLYAGIILHDIGKTKEFSGIQNADYTLKGQLLGHLVIGGIEIAEVAKELSYDNKEEVLILEHMLISHHGQPQFGAAKRPMTAEAIVLWYIDTMDSKFRMLGEELEKIDDGEFTDQIGVLERAKVYKTKAL